MSIENMKRISGSEEEAVSIRKQAQADSKKLLEQGKKQAAELVETARKQADDAYRDTLRQAEAEAEKAYQTRMAEVAAECDAMKAQAEKRLAKAAQIIAGKVVKSSGNR